MATPFGFGLPRRTKIERRIEDRSDSDDDLFFTVSQPKPRSQSFDVRCLQSNSLEEFINADLNTTFGNESKVFSLGRLVEGATSATGALGSCSSLVDGLLFDIYDKWHYPQRDSIDSDTFTECSGTSDAFFGRSDSLQLPEFEQRHANWYPKASLEQKDTSELRAIYYELRHRTGQASAILIRQLKRRDRRKAKAHKNYDLVTAILQAASLKRSIDARIRFSVEPLPGDDAFQQWRHAMKAVARLPLGIPPEFRKKVWLALADQHISNIKLDWEKTKKFAFNEKSNPDDNKLGMQIVKDLHRTGCSGFNGRDNEEDRAVLKRVLLAYARWNKTVGYCQGFNVIAALILEVMERKEDDALKVMILLIDHVLPESYFANNLRALSVDMAVFRDLLGIHLPQLSRHLDHLQTAATDDATGANYEPPLTNVFTMQWFLTLFATCLPNSTALRVWDSILLEGSELLFRTSLAIWEKLQDRILAVPSADEFYMMMGSMTQEMLDEGTTIMDADSIIKLVYGYGPFPLPNLADLREKYTYNITPFTAAMSTGRRPNARGRAAMNLFSDEDDWDEDDISDQINCFTGIFPMQVSPNRTKPGELDRSQSSSSYDISKVGPGAFGTTPLDESSTAGSAYEERMTMDLHLLKNQYKRLRHRQKQAHIMLTAATAARKKDQGQSASWMPSSKSLVPSMTPPIESPVAVNHLFIGKNGLQKSNKNKHVAEAPNIAPLFPQMSKSRGHTHRSRSGSVKSDPGGKLGSFEKKTDMLESQKRRQSKENCDIEETVSNKSQESIQEDKEDVQGCPELQDNSQSEGLSSGLGEKEEGLCLGEAPKVAENVSRPSTDSKPGTTDVQAKDLENTSQYLAQMMFSRQKKTLVQAANHEKNNNVNDSETLGNKVNDGAKQGSVSPNAHKTHNPFTIRMNPSRAQNGVKLGLYSPDNIPVVELGSKRITRNGVKEIGRAQLNACLHRQYMAEVRQQGRKQ